MSEVRFSYSFFFFYYGEKWLSDSKTVAINFFIWGFNMQVYGNCRFLEPDSSGH